MILSVSRRTDIPAFFSEWFYNRINDGYVYVRNPMNQHQVSNIKLSPENIECIVFWTKNPSQHFIDNLYILDELGYKYYFQFTVTSYNQNTEPQLPKKEKIANIFKHLSNKIGKDKIIWRYDPIFFSDEYTIEYHTKYFEFLAKYLSSYTEKCIISFIDIYPRISKRLVKQGIRELTLEQMYDMGQKIHTIADSYGLKVESCCETIDLSKIGIEHGHCISGTIINNITKKQFKFEKDKTQRQDCGCITSVDIGTYNTCRHNCIYCYANWTEKQRLDCNNQSPLLCSEIHKNDKVTDRVLKKCDMLHTELLFEFEK